jgi:hypothetical protein
MNRRAFLANAGLLIPAGLVRHSFADNTSSAGLEIPLHIDVTRTVATIPADFIGLGYEISSVARPGLLSATNSAYVQLVRSLGKRGVIRVGGNTADYASYLANGTPVSLPEGKGGSVVNDAVLHDLGEFLEATGWQLIWALNLGSGSLQNAVDEARAVMRAVGDRLLAFEIGNEPDLFSHNPHRHRNYGYNDYLREFRQYREALQKAIPGIPFAAPDAATATDWVTRFAKDERSNIKLLTEHYYRDGAKNPTSTIDELLHPDPKLTTMLQQLKAASESSGLPYRICETNSFYGGGKAGVSDTFASALWVLDFMFSVASGGCAGVNMETGVNQLGFISHYSPIGDDEHGHYWAAPEYYGMLAFAQTGVGRIVGCSVDAGGKNISAYATQPDAKRLMLTIINKEADYHAEVAIKHEMSASFKTAQVLQLSAPSLESKSGIALGEAAVSASGAWHPASTTSITFNNAGLKLRVPHASALVATLSV